MFIEPNKFTGELMILEHPNPIRLVSRPRLLVAADVVHAYAAQNIYCMKANLDRRAVELLAELVADIDAQFEVLKQCVNHFCS